MAEPDSITPEEREACVRVLQRVSEDPSLIAADERLKALIAKIHRHGKKAARRGERTERQEADWNLRATTAMVQRDLRQQPFAAEVPLADAAPAALLHHPAPCYICKRSYRELHPVYHQLCPECAALNYAHRSQRADLQGRVALLTGGRVKIGFQLALRLLRDGARVILTTRFPSDAGRRFAAEPDFPEWRERLRVEGLDLRNLRAVEAFTAQLSETEPHLDILINNAAQTIKRPLSFYQHLLEGESIPHLLELSPGYPVPEEALPALLGALTPLPAGSPALHFPAGLLDPDGQQVDRRPRNSWALKLQEVGTLELLEVHLVNAIAPFLLCRELRPLLLRSPFSRRFIVHVSAMEGQFARETKTEYHPHTNMAKAALNMLTRTSAAGFAREGIYMNSVDTGWITDEHPHDRRVRRQQRDRFFTPLDVLDGMARVYDPIVRGITEPEEPLFGLFLKDYASFPW